MIVVGSLLFRCFDRCFVVVVVVVDVVVVVVVGGDSRSRRHHPFCQSKVNELLIDSLFIILVKKIKDDVENDDIDSRLKSKIDKTRQKILECECCVIWQKMLINYLAKLNILNSCEFRIVKLLFQ